MLRSSPREGKYNCACACVREWGGRGIYGCVHMWVSACRPVLVIDVGYFALYLCFSTSLLHCTPLINPLPQVYDL